MANPENVIGKGKLFAQGDARTLNAAQKGGRTRAAQVNLQKTMTKILGAQPRLTERMIERMQEQGLDLGDSELTNTAALIGLVLTNKALAGDLEAAKMVLEMAGQITDSKTVTERERLKIEKQRLRMLERGHVPQAEMPVIIDTRPADPEPAPETESQPEGSEAEAP